MRPLLAACLLLALGCGAKPPTPVEAPPPANDPGPPSGGVGGAVALIGVTVIDPASNRQIEGQTVLFEGDQISAVGPSVEIPKGATRVNLEGKYVLPGLWDMHVHWFDERNLGLFLANGVTGVRMMSGTPAHLGWRKRFDSGELLSPRLYLASNLFDGPQPVWPGTLAITDSEQARREVRNAKAAGFDFLKVYQGLSKESFAAIADEAKQQGIPFSGHVSDSLAIEEVVAAGQRSVEHMMVVRAAATRLGVDSLARMLKSNDTWICPTLSVSRNICGLTEEDVSTSPHYRYLPEKVRSNWQSMRRGSYKPERFKGEQVTVGALHKRGVGIIAGTDCWIRSVHPGFSLPDELRLYVEAGLTPAASLATATVSPARFMKRGDMGRVAAGSVADLVVLDANPLADIGNLKKVRAVVGRGRYYDRSDLDGMLRHAERVAQR